MKKKLRSLTNKAGDVRDDLTIEELRGFRPLSEVDPELLARVLAEQKKRGRGPGRPAGRTKKPVSISLDQDLLELLRKSGTGWQTRVNALLRAAMGLSTPQ
jgi:uncharacterized protein (DUF4415 family)